MSNLSDVKPLLEWYFFYKRDFPWRTQIYIDRHDWTYHTWVCEVMSQQTIISVVIPKFKKFIAELPDVFALANCSDELLRYLWSGLGYYARARNLRNGAKTILSQYNGQFPTTKKEWLNVPGCGEYTASIIASICFSEPVAAIDGNMIRVVSRLLGLKAQVWEKVGQQKISHFMASLMLSSHSNYKPGDINQAFMDLGSMVCKKNSPLCHECPLQNSCLAYKQNIVSLCPPVKPRKENQEEDVYALVYVNCETQLYLLVERDSGFLAKTIGFPLFTKIQFIQSGLKASPLEKTFRHQITNHKITGFVTLVEGECSLANKKFWVPFSELKKQLSSSLDQKVLKTLSY